MKFVLVSNHRSGSKILRAMLNNVGGIHCREEILRSVPEPADARLIADFFLSEPKHGCLGFDLKYSHSSSGVEKYIHDNKVKIIQLIRRDMLETVLWQKKNLHGKLQGGLGPPLVLRDTSYEAKTDGVIEDVMWLKKEISRWQKMADVVVYYEDDLTNNKHVSEFYNEKKLAELLALFGKAPKRLHFETQGGLKKNKRPANEEIISNWDELIKELKSHGINWIYEN